MQNNGKNPWLTATRREKLLAGLRLLVLLSVVGFVVQALRQHQTGFADILVYARRSLTAAHAALLAGVLLLTPLNWALEALKWRQLAAKIQAVSFPDAFRGVLAGLALGFATPANLGDYAGRLYALKTDRRFENLGAVVLGNGMQFYVSLLGGTVAYAFFLRKFNPQPAAVHATLLVLLVLTLLFGVWVVVRRRSLTGLFDRYRWLQPVGRYVAVVGRYSPAELGRVFGWAVLRYGVFTGQFLGVLVVFGIDLPPADAACGVALVFFAKTVIPAFHFLSDLGVREFTALYFFSFYAVAPAAVVSATLSLWTINILLPVLVGAGWLVQRRFWTRPNPQPVQPE
jgi:cation transporter-like permease